MLLDLRPDDLRAAVESAVEQSASAAERRGVRLSLHLPDAPIRIRHDPPRVGQIVANLVANAIKFTPRGGSVAVDVAGTADGARIEVTDTGVGIDPVEMPHIFERFYRGSRANEARGSGSGLGLAIVRSIVDMHGGTIEVESRVGAGTRFIVDLPRDPRLVEGTPAADAGRGRRSGGRRSGDARRQTCRKLHRPTARRSTRNRHPETHHTDLGRSPADHLGDSPPPCTTNPAPAPIPAT